MGRLLKALISFYLIGMVNGSLAQKRILNQLIDNTVLRNQLETELYKSKDELKSEQINKSPHEVDVNIQFKINKIQSNINQLDHLSRQMHQQAEYQYFGAKFSPSQLTSFPYTPSDEVRKNLNYSQTFSVENYNNFREFKKNGFYYKSNYLNKNTVYLKFKNLHANYYINISCQGPFSLKGIFKNKPAKKIKNNYTLTTTIYSQDKTANLKLVFGSSTKDCLLSFKKNNKYYTIFLSPEESYIRRLGTQPMNTINICNAAIPINSTTRTQDFFFSLSGPYTSCADKLSTLKTIEDGQEALQAKIKLLLGTELNLEKIPKQIDFSNTPKYDSIFISSLNYASDEVGALFTRILKHHAKNGTQIRIIASNKTVSKKDNKLLFEFDEQFPNVQFQKIKYTTGYISKSSFSDALSNLHKVNHIKTFLTYSKDVPHLNKAILGGRNIRKIYHIDKVNRHHPFNYDDFDYLITDKTAVHNLHFSLLKLWSYYSNPFYVIPSNIHTNKKQTSSKSYSVNDIYIKNQHSFPSFDQKILENNFVDLFDSASRKICIVTPYFNFTEKIFKSIQRAIGRGIKIEIITDLDLAADEFGSITSGINTKTANKLLNDISIYNYNVKNKILHSKIILIDDEFSVLGSVNLNQRSFFHDLENISYILSRDVNSQIQKTVDKYIETSTLIEKKGNVDLLIRFLSRIVNDAF